MCKLRAECETRDSEELQVAKFQRLTSTSRTENLKPEKHESAGTLFRKWKSRLPQSEPEIKNWEGDLFLIEIYRF